MCGAREPCLNPMRDSNAAHLLKGRMDIWKTQAFREHSLLETTRVYVPMVPGALAG